METSDGLAKFPLEFLALGLLMHEPKHGYSLYQDYTAEFGSVWQVGRSKFYASLADLQSAGSLDCETEPQGDHPPRKTYSITKAGRQRFLAWLNRPVTPVRAIRVEFLAKLRFFDLLGLDGALPLIEAQRAICQQTLDRWRDQRERMPEHGEEAFFELTYRFREEQAQFILTWLDECQRYFEQTIFNSALSNRK